MRWNWTLLAVAGTLLLLAAGSLLPQLIFQAQDGFDQSGPQSVQDESLSLDLTSPAESFWLRLNVVGTGGHQASMVVTSFMTCTEDQIFAVTDQLMETYSAMGLLPEGEPSEIGAVPVYAWAEALGDSFGVWYVTYSWDAGGYCVFVMDDALRLPLSIYGYQGEDGPAYELEEAGEVLMEPFVELLSQVGCTDYAMNRYVEWDGESEYDISYDGMGLYYDLYTDDGVADSVLFWLQWPDWGLNRYSSISLSTVDEPEEESADVAMTD